MKKIFNIEIKEIIKDTFEIEAENEEEALIKAEEGYYSAKYVLDDIEKSDLTFTNIDNPKYVSESRKQELINKLAKAKLNDIFENYNTEEISEILRDCYGFTKEEIVDQFPEEEDKEKASKFLEQEQNFEEEEESL